MLRYIYPHGRIIVFARAPVPGKTKTRLIPALGKAGAAKFHEKLISHSLSIAVASRICPLSLYVAGDMRHPLFNEWRTYPSINIFQQKGKDLGQRMNAAMNQQLVRSHWTLLIGSDCLEMDAQYLTTAASHLGNNPGAVLGPARDGGYVLLGLSKPAPALFQFMPWGTNQVAKITRKRLRMSGTRWMELPTLADIDRPEDLYQHQTLVEPN